MEQEEKRLEQFRRLRKEIRGSQETLVVGIDISKDTHNAFMRTTPGKTLYRRLIFNNTREGFETLLLQVEAVRMQHGLKEVVFGMEPTANYHKPLGEFLINKEQQVVLVSPETVKQNRPLFDGRWNKHDGKDCANIADLMCQGKCLFYEYPSLELRDLRNLLSLNRKLKKLEQGLRLRIRNHLVAQYFPEMDQYCHWGANEGLALVRWCLDPAVMGKLSDEELVKRVHTEGRTMAQRKRLSALKDKAPSSIGCQFGDSVEFEGQSVVKLLKEVRQRMADTRARIEQVCLKFKEYSCLLSIPGFGPSLSAMVLGAIGNPWRFQNGSAGYQDGGLGSLGQSERKVPGFARGIEERQGRDSLCVVPGGNGGIDSGQTLCGVLHRSAAQSGKRKRDQDQETGKARGQVVDDCLDLDEKTGAFRSAVSRCRRPADRSAQERQDQKWGYTQGPTRHRSSFIGQIWKLFLKAHNRNEPSA